MLSYQHPHQIKFPQCQIRKNNPNIRRRIKRDKEINDKKGVAGIVKSSRRNQGNRSRGTPV